MWSQIIFFAAVALLVVVLISRSIKTRLSSSQSSSPRFPKQAPKINFSFFTEALLGAWNWVSNLFSRKKVSRQKQPTAASLDSHLSHDGANNKDAHVFWKEEAVSGEMSLGTHFEEGEALFKNGKLAEAEQFFVKAAANNPGDPKVYARLGLLYLQTKNYSDAIESLKVATKLDKHNPSRYYNLALAYSGNKDTQKAIAAVREAITLDPVTPKYRQLLDKLLNG